MTIRYRAQNRVSTALLLCFLSGGLLAPETSAADKSSNPEIAPPAMAMFDASGSFAPMLSRVVPAVVTILVTGATLQPVDLQPRKSDGTLSPTPAATKETFRAGGSGVIVDAARGHILTNNHVIEDAIRIEVSLSDGRRMLARLVGRDAATDVAVIEVAERDLPELPIGDSTV